MLLTRDDFLCIEWIWRFNPLSPGKSSAQILRLHDELEKRVIQNYQDCMFYCGYWVRIDEKPNDVTTFQRLQKQIIEHDKASSPEESWSICSSLI